MLGTGLRRASFLMQPPGGALIFIQIPEAVV